MANLLSFAGSLRPRLLSWLGGMAALAALALLGWFGAGIFWKLTTPLTTEPAIAVDTDPMRSANAVAAKHLFGEAPVQKGIAVASLVASDIKLFGVVAAGRKDRPGVAIVSVKGKPPVAIREGDEVTPGVIVQRVLVRSVEISSARGTQVLSLPERGKS